MLDVIGTAEELGKSVGTDAATTTFVQLYGLQTCDKLVREHTAVASDALRVFQNTEFMCKLTHNLVVRTY